jgi:cellulose synthase/poly-beta-1,6-N-acetylglucosamine synthase-like glycosyltransferase
MTEEQSSPEGHPDPVAPDERLSALPPPTAESSTQATSIEESGRPPIASAPLSVVLVVRDTDADCEGVVAGWMEQITDLSREYEILLVGDGSSDEVPRLAESLGKQYPHLKLLRNDESRGIGAALRTGLAAARHPLICYTTCDREYDPSNLKHLLQWIDQTDLVGGYRVSSSGGRARTIGELVLRWLARILFAVRLRDPECFFLLARRSIFGRIPIQSDGPFALIEILAKANFLGCIMSEAPVTFRPRDRASSPTTGAFSQALAELCRVFFGPDFGPRDVLTDAQTPSDRLSATQRGAQEDPL